MLSLNPGKTGKVGELLNKGNGFEMSKAWVKINRWKLGTQCYLQGLAKRYCFGDVLPKSMTGHQPESVTSLTP